MHYLYVLKSTVKNRHYIGITGDIQKRLANHNRKAVKSTKAHTPWQVVYLEKFLEKKLARQREIFLKKTAKARIELYSKFNNNNIAPIV